MTTAEFLDIALNILSVHWRWMLVGAILVQPVDALLVLGALVVVLLERRKGVR